MRTHTCFLKMAAFAALATAVLQPASAATITYDSYLPSIGYQFWAGPSQFSQFDPSLGTLDGVTYAVSGVLTFSVSQDAPFTISPMYSYSKGLTLNGTGLSPRDPNTDSDMDAILNGGLTFEPLAPGVTVSQARAVDFLRTPDLGFGPFIGTGTIATELDVSEDSDNCYSQDFFTTGSTYHMTCSQSGGLTVSVSYDYTPVPEPKTLGLCGIGLMALVAVRRRARCLSETS